MISGLKFGWFLILKIWEIVERLSVLLVRLYIVLVGIVINCFVFNKVIVWLIFVLIIVNFCLVCKN